MAADHEKEEEEGWTRGLMQGFQAAGQKLVSIKQGLRTADCGLRTADCGLRTADHALGLGIKCRLRTEYKTRTRYKMRTTD